MRCFTRAALLRTGRGFISILALFCMQQWLGAADPPPKTAAPAATPAPVGEALAGSITIPNAARPWEKYQIHLSRAEMTWLAAHPVLRYGFDPNWPPFSFRDGGKGALEGIDVDLMAKLAERLGVRFEPIATNSWEETDRKLHAGQVDVVSGIARSESREQYLLFTSSYITCPVAVITRAEAPFMTSLHDLKNVTLASPRGYVTTESLMRDYPALPLVQTATVRDALTLVSEKKADVTIENLPSANYTIKQAGLNNLKIAGITDYRFALCLAVRKETPELQSILEKTLNSLTDAERRTVTDKWTAVEYFPENDWAPVWRIAGALLACGAVVFGLFTLWNRRLAAELDERKKAEAALKEAHDRLHALNTEKDRFMTMAAHDLNNPLSAILMKCMVFELDGEHLGRDMHDLLSTIRNNAQRMTHLIKNILNADRLEQGQMMLKIEPLDLAELVQETIRNLHPCAECKHIRLEFSRSPAPLRIAADRAATLQVLENLLSNAIKYTPPGKLVSIRTEGRSGFGRVEVRDQGPGIQDRDRPKLFMKYVTLSARPTANENSNGLGLSIAKGFMDAMKGRIACESKPGEGALFVVEFPLAPSLVSSRV